MDQLNRENEDNLIDFQSSLTQYIMAIETLMKAIEKKEKDIPHDCLSMSKPILLEILAQTLDLKKRRLPPTIHSHPSLEKEQNRTPEKQWILPHPPLRKIND